MKKIMFNDRFGLTEAVLSGRKTQTRRLIPQEFFSLTWDYRGDTLVYENDFGDLIDIRKSKYARYKVGEVLAVAQSYKSIFEEDCRRLKEGKTMFNVPIRNVCDQSGWINKMFVRAAAMPHCIRITDVRVERLQDISEEDCIKEGILRIPELDTHYFEDRKIEQGHYFWTPREAYAALIDKISGKGAWVRNPYVFIYDFELV